MARQLLESSPVRFRPEILKADLTEDVQIQGGDAVKPLMKVRGIFQKYNEKNANNRIYPKELFDRCLNEESWTTRISENSVVGCLEHPDDGITKLTGPISHIVTKAWDKGNGEIWGEAVVLNTPDGRKIGSLFEAGVPVGISSRGEGEVSEDVSEGGVQRVIPESFQLITFDFVHDNSVPGARVSPITGESKSSKSTKKEVTEETVNKEYLTPNPPMAKNLIGEMRKAGLAFKRVSGTSPKSLNWQEKTALYEEVQDIRTQIATYMNEDRSVVAYGNKLLKEMDDFEAGFEDGGEEPSDHMEGNGAPEGMQDEAQPHVDQGAFDEVLKAVLRGMNPECENADLQGAYQEFCDTGKVDVHGLVSKCSSGGEGGEFDADAEMGGGPAEDEGNDEGFEDDDFGDKNAFESKELRAAVELIAHLRESAQNGERYRQFSDELKERIRVHHPLLKELEEARKKLATMEGSSDWEARVARNKELLARARQEIASLTKALGEEKQVTSAMAALLKEHGVKDGKKLIEGDSEWFKKNVLDKNKKKMPGHMVGKETAKIGFKKGKKEDEEEEKTEESKITEEEGGVKLGTGEKETKVGKAPISNVTTSETDDIEGIPDGECDDEGQKAPNVKDGDKEGVKLGTGEKAKTVGSGKTGESKEKVTESKEEDHDLLRMMNRFRSNPFSQL